VIDALATKLCPLILAFSFVEGLCRFQIKNMSRSINEVSIGLLSRREHSILELRRKLLRKSFTEDEIEQAIQRLLDNNLLSEERFTESYINMRKRKGYGPVRIAQELRERGIDSDFFEDYLDRNNTEWRVVMKQQYTKKYGDELAEEYAEKAKRAKYLQARGFPLDWVFKLNSMDEYDY
jgi:regulatory protein